MSYYLNLSILSNNPNKVPKTERTQRLSAEARRILSQYEGKSLTNEDIAREASGRPFFPNRDMDFSISHSGALAAVSLVTGGGKNLRTGCDVELVRPRAGAGRIAREFFTAPEKNYIEAGGDFDLTRFYQIWTLKECFLKLRGLSVFDMAAAPSFVSSENQHAFVGVSPLSFSLYELSGGAGERYIVATAIEPQPSGECREGSPLARAEAEPPEIRWFSQEELDCSSIANINAAPSPAETVRPKI